MNTAPKIKASLRTTTSIVGKVFFRFAIVTGVLAFLVSFVLPIYLFPVVFWLPLQKLVGRESFLIGPLAFVAALALVPQIRLIKVPEKLHLAIRIALRAIRIAVQCAGALGIVILMRLSVQRYDDFGICRSDNIDSTAISPDGKKRAELHFCDAWPDASEYLDITGDVSAGLLERHPTFEPNEVTMRWVDNNTLAVTPMPSNGVTSYAGVHLQ